MTSQIGLIYLLIIFNLKHSVNENRKKGIVGKIKSMRDWKKDTAHTREGFDQ